MQPWPPLPTAPRDPLALHFFEMACQNAWANVRLLHACSGLDVPAWTQERHSFFPSLQLTWRHIHQVDLFYVAMLERESQGLPPDLHPERVFDLPVPDHAPQPFARAQAAADWRLIQHCAALDAASLARPVTLIRRRGVEVNDRVRWLAHLFQHQIHHRGQIHAMLTLTEVRPPQLDEFFCSSDAEARAPELALMGWQESQIHPPRT